MGRASAIKIIPLMAGIVSGSGILVPISLVRFFGRRFRVAPLFLPVGALLTRLGIILSFDRRTLKRRRGWSNDRVPRPGF